jgi:WD40 repeat protein
MVRSIYLIIIFILFSFLPLHAQDEAKFNAYGLKVFTIESEHFRISYLPGLEHTAKEAGEQFEKLYRIYSGIYEIKLPSKTEVLVIEGEEPNGFAFSNLNMVVIWATDIDMNLRGTREWLKGVVSHEFAHIVSIWTSLKFPPNVEMIEFGGFTHPNSSNRLDLLHAMPSSILPYWFTEGIAQYEDSKFGTELWDSHRDMILRSLALTDKLLTWDHLYAQTGNRGDDYEKGYNHGFSLVAYMANHYGYDRIVSLLRESSLIYRLGFDGAIKAVLGISGRQLYKNWKDSIVVAYRAQVSKIGTQVYGKKINKDGFDNYWPKFSPDAKKIFFLSNGTGDYSSVSKCLYSYSLLDTQEDKRIKVEKSINGFYSICPSTGLMAFTSRESSESDLAPSKGGIRVFDAYLDSLPPEKKKFQWFPKSKRHQVTKKQSIFSAVFSPTGNMLACAQRIHDRFYLALADTGGKKTRIVYPVSNKENSLIKYIFSLDWSPDGRHIAMSFRDSTNRKIGVYDTLTREFSELPNSDHDDRDPRYGADDSTLYFSSDKTGIFNIYRYNLHTRSIQRLTNVSGGAFAPDISPKGKKLAFAGYNENGYGIYLMDTIKVLEESPGDSFVVQNADTLFPPRLTVAFSAPRLYSNIPNKFLLYPMLMTQEILSKANDPFKGMPTFEVGAMFDFFDIRGLLGSGGGSDIRAYLILEPQKILSFIQLSKGFFSPYINYEFGFFGTTKLLPVALSLNYLQRGLTGSDHFWDEIEGKDQVLDYGIKLRNLDLIVSHPLGDALKLHAIASYNWYDVFLNTKDLFGIDLPYTPAQWPRLGAFLTCFAPSIDSKMLISPKGLYGKLQYDFQYSYLMNDDKGFNYDDSTGQQTVNYDFYQTQQVSVSLKMGMSSPWYEKHDLYFEFRGLSLITNQEIIDRIRGRSAANEKNIPPFFQPMEWMPGYAYFYQDTAKKVTGTDTSRSIRDTAVLGGKTVALASASYRFPLWPKSIDTKIWFLYLDRLYGAFNFATGAGWQSLSDIRHFKKEDWLSSVGAEIRLEAVSFSYLPMAIKLRWDRGLNDRKLNNGIQPANVGGDRYTLGISFSFDNWEMIDEPDYSAVRIPHSYR